MNTSRLLAFAAPVLLLVLPAVRAGAPAPMHYSWTPGQTLRYLIQRDPYFDDPARAVETADPRAPYRPPVVERLTERVEGVRPDGTAILRVSVAPEPGFEDDAHPQRAETRTLTVSPLGEVSGAGGDFACALFPLTATQAERQGGLAVLSRVRPATATRGQSPDHDGTLVQMTRAARVDRAVFDPAQGTLVRQTSVLHVMLSLVMTGRGRRGGADFGHVIPNMQVTQTLTVERKDAAP